MDAAISRDATEWRQCIPYLGWVRTFELFT